MSAVGELALRRARPQDLEFFRQLRNLPEVRMMSRRTHLFTHADTHHWVFEEGIEFHVASHGGHPCGYLAFKPEGGACEISIALHPNAQGRGLARSLLRRAPLLHPRQDLIATVRPDNLRSLALFLDCGFHHLPDRDGYHRLLRPALTGEHNHG